jgi:hypothetical protein
MGDVVRLVRSGKTSVSTGEPVRLTKRTVEDVRAAANGAERFLWDAELKGFGVRASPSGLAMTRCAECLAISTAVQAGRVHRQG